MKKLAQKPASFDESVPSTDAGLQASDSQGQAQPQKNAKVDPNSDQYAAVPINGEEQMEQEQTQGSNVPPEMVAAAQSFLGPEVMQAAMSGDPNAADLVARAAAHFGSTFMNMTAGNAQAAVVPGAEGMDPAAAGGVPGQQAPVGITTPEEDLAAELVPNVPSPQQAVPGAQGTPMPQDIQASQVAGQESSMEAASGKDVAQEQPNVPGQDVTQGDGQQMVDIATVVKLINLVKAGKI
jgi:hypothetical protein